MNRRKWITLGVSVLVIILFAIVILTAFNFKKDREEVFEDYTNNELPNESDEIIFHNSSDLTEEEIRTLVEEKRTSLKDVIENAQYYKASDVSEENLILENATNDKITTIINIKLCEENTDDNCTRDSYYRFILEKEQEEWKIADFETEM